MTHSTRSIVLLVVLLASACCGYLLGRSSHQNINALQRAGFVVIDPEGYEVERFEEGLLSAFPSYWTTTDKP